MNFSNHRIGRIPLMAAALLVTVIESRPALATGSWGYCPNSVCKQTGQGSSPSPVLAHPLPALGTNAVAIAPHFDGTHYDIYGLLSPVNTSGNYAFTYHLHGTTGWTSTSHNTLGLQFDDGYGLYSWGAAGALESYDGTSWTNFGSHYCGWTNSGWPDLMALNCNETCTLSNEPGGFCFSSHNGGTWNNETMLGGAEQITPDRSHQPLWDPPDYGRPTLYALDSSGVPWFYIYTWYNDSWSKLGHNFCSGSGTGDAGLVQIAAANGYLFGIAGNSYDYPAYYTPSGSCWTVMSGGTSFSSIATDYGGSSYYAYGVDIWGDIWVLDGAPY